MDPYSSHVPVLAACIRLLSRPGEDFYGPVLELGVGDYSTPLLHLAIQDRSVVSVDTKADWIERFADLRRPGHEIIQVATWHDWHASPVYRSMYWELAFIDHGAFYRRAADAAALKGRCRFVVVHDSEPERAASYRYHHLHDLYAHAHTFGRSGPWTTVFSDHPIPLPEWSRQSGSV